MVYQALYRKFRPQDFNDVKGQNHIVKTLENQIKANRIGHAYLFCGTRGTGKTTVAKVLAKAVNCENPVEGNPCNECSICKNINNQTIMNVIEIDAASNNGVDNVREIVEEVCYSPTQGRFKVYIIDEVHMLTTSAFNALLKTLEEPPSYVIFILATTEPQKLPLTILSRCQRYNFKRITNEVITKRLIEVIEAEKIEAEEKALRYIARMAEGSMRDGLSLLDQCISFYIGEKLTYDGVLGVLGAMDVEVYSSLLAYIIRRKVSGAMELLERVTMEGRDLSIFITEFTWYLRNLLLVKSSEKNLEKIDISSEDIPIFKEQANKVDMNAIIRYIHVLADLSNKIKYSSQKRVLVEVAIIKLMTPQMELDKESLLERIRLLEDKVEQGVVIQSQSKREQAPAIEKVPVVDKAKQENEKNKEIAKALPEDLKAIGKSWSHIVAKVPASWRPHLQKAKPHPGANSSLILSCTDFVDLDRIAEKQHIAELKVAISKVLNKEIDIDIQYKSGDSKEGKREEGPDLRKLIKHIEIEYED